MTVTPNLGLTLMTANMAQKEVVFNEQLVAFDALFAGTILSAALNAPPSSPAMGAAYIVGGSPTGLWSSQAYNIAVYYNGWQFYTPPLQIQLYDVATSSFLRYEGSTEHWVTVPPSSVAVLDDLSDVSGASSATNGQVLTWNSSATKWEPASPTFTASLATLTDVEITEGSGINGYYLTYNHTDAKWEATALPTLHSTFLSLTDVSLTGVENNYVLVYTTTGPGVKFVAQSSILATTTVASLSDVGDVSYGAGLTVGDALLWNGSVWGPSSSTATYSFAGMSDGPGAFTGHANDFLSVNSAETALQYQSLSSLLSDVVIKLQSLSDVPASIGTTGQVLAVNSSANGFVYITPTNALAVTNNGTSVDTAATTLNFVNASSITTSSHDVTVTLPVATPLVFKDHGTTESTTVTTVDFEGAGVTLSETGGVLTVTVAATTTALASLTDVSLTSPTNGQLLSYNTGASKWENASLSTVLATLSNTAQPALYELGAFAPPTSAMFPNAFQAASLNISSIANRGLTMQPASYGSGSYAVVVSRILSANSTPWTVTCRVSPNSYESSGHGAGICLLRSANNAMIYLCIGNDGASGETFTVRFGKFASGGATETVLTTANVEAMWLQLSFDGTYVRARISSDGLMWNAFGSAQQAAVVLGGVPDSPGLFQRLVAATAGDAGGLYTYYDDPDYPATGHTVQGVVNLALSALSDVQVTEGSSINGYTLNWNNSAGKWEPVAPVSGGSGTLAADTDVSISSPATNNVLAYNSSSKWANFTLTALIDAALGNTQGDVLYRGSASWGVLAPGTSGQVLTTGGSGANPSWTTVSGGGSGSLAGDSDVSLTSPANHNFLTYNGSAWVDSTLTAALDSIFGNTQGDILFRGASAWQVLAPGTSGNVLTTGGSGANPSWASGGGGGGSSTLATLTDVNVSEGSGIDGYFLKWNNSTSKWIAAAVSGGGGGSSTLAGDSDVNISSPADGQVLQFNLAASAWENVTPSVGGGLLPPQYENGPFAPPSTAWFSTTPSASPVTSTLTSHANQGMSLSATGFTGPNQCAIAGRSPSAWGSSWAVTARMIGSVMHDQYPGWGIMLIDTSGKAQGVIVCNTGTTQVNPQIVYGLQLNNVNNNFNNVLSVRYPAKVPEWFRARYDGTNYYYGTSYDGIQWEEYSTSATGFLGTLAYVGLSLQTYNNNVVGSQQGAILVTYYDDPDYPASGHETLTSATLSSLADVSVVEGAAIDGCFLKYHQATGDWIAATGSGGSGLTPPLSTNFTAVTNLNSATLTDRTSGAIPSLAVAPGSGAGDSKLYCALQAAPTGSFSLVVKVKASAYGDYGGWNGAGPVVYNSANGNATYIWLTPTAGPQMYSGNFSGSFNSGSAGLGANMPDQDFFQHIDYDGTNVKLGISRNGVDVSWAATATLSSFLDAITHVGFGWSGGSSNSLIFDFVHFHVGSLGTSGITSAAGGGGSATLAGDSDVAISGTPTNNEYLAYNTVAGYWINQKAPLNIAISITGLMVNSEILLNYVFPYAGSFPASLTGSFAKANSAATGSTVVTIKKNGTTIGTMTWSASATSATFSFTSAVSFAAGDVLQLFAPSSADATLADIGITFAGTRS